ncbi:hypothetical protein R3P38DRAFT_3267532 [Favolaschia claudopus]|uniref:Proteophosphoglycan ppg4 n=1 Tax=Favolaschia claudopus TaxID=2862362 RepID=A0AAW0BQ84_9AGAR
MGFAPFHRIGMPGAHYLRPSVGKTPAKRADAATPDPSCATGAFYTSPALGASLSASSPLPLTWSPSLSCLQPAPSLLDVYLSAPGDASPLLRKWEGVPYAAGAYNLTVNPGWYNSAAAKQVQIMAVPAGTPVFLSTIPAGPVFTLTFASDAAAGDAAKGELAASGGTTTVTPTTLSGVSHHTMSAGKKAAAILLPLLFVGLCVLAYLKMSRARGAAKRSAWSEKLDKRMSTISADWKSITPGGAREGVRASMAVARNSSSVYGYGSVGNIGKVEGEPVVMGEKSSGVSVHTARGGSIEINEKDLPRTSLGTGVGVGVGARRPRTNQNPPERASRAVSFAESAHPRPSLSSTVGVRMSRGSRAFHTASFAGDEEDDVTPVPPVPALPSPARAGAFGAIERAMSGGSPTITSPINNKVYGNQSAWTSGERVEGVDGGYGARSVSPTGRVHSVVYPGTLDTTTAIDADASYFSPVTPTPHQSAFTSASAYGSPAAFSNAYGGYEEQEEGAGSAYLPNTFGSFVATPSQGSSTPSDNGLGVESPRQVGGPLTLTPEDIRRRMTMRSDQQDGWRASVDEVFGALSLMRTGTSTHNVNGNNGTFDNNNMTDMTAEADADEYLFAPPAETVFQYPGTPAPGSGFGSPNIPPALPTGTSSTFPASAASPFAMPMQPPTMSPDAMLRAYAAKTKHTSTATGNSGAEVVSGLKDTGMRVLYSEGEEARASSPVLMRVAGKAGKPGKRGSGGR